MSNIVDIARRHLQRVRPAGDDNIQARCPFHDTKSGTPFSMNSRTGMWICFSCGAHGSFHRFLYRLGYSREQVDTYAKMANLDDTISSFLRNLGMGRKKWSVLPEYVLGAYEGCPISLLTAGFQMDLLREHDVGYDRLEDRITFPIRDYFGRLVAVSGRTQSNWVEPRYKVYEEPFKVLFEDGDYEPKAKLHLYGMHSVYPQRYRTLSSPSPLVLVEGYKGCLWMRQLGFEDTVAFMGSIASQMQIWILSRLRGPYYLLLDNEPGKAFPDEKGRWAARDIAERLAPAGASLLCQYPPGSPIGTSPDDLTREQAVQMVRDAKSLAQLAVCQHASQSTWSRKKINVVQQIP